MIRRIAVVVVAVVGTIGLTMLLPAEGPAPATPTLLPDPVVLGASAEASTWYCTASSDASATPTTHVVTIGNPTGRALSAAVSGYGSTAGAAPTTTTVQLPARTSVNVDRAGLGGDATGAVMVEASGGGIVVSHRLVNGRTSDEVPCATAPSGAWYFSAVNTQLGNSARLWLFNPFAADAAVDITVAYADGVRIPRAFSGLVIPARTARLVDLGATVQRRDQFAIAVNARAGQFTAELVQHVEGAGLRVDPGMSRTSRRIMFADSFGAANVTERLVVFNPGRVAATATVSVRPDGADSAAYPEPFTLDVPARRYVELNLETETRLSPTGSRTLVVDTDLPGGLVATRVVAATKAPNGLGVEAGLANSAAGTVAAGTWVVPRIDPAAPGRSFVRIVNTSTDSIAVVRLIVAAAGKDLDAVPGGKVEVPAAGAITIDVGAAVPADTQGVLTVASSAPIVVERRAAASNSGDFWTLSAVPVASTVAPLGELPGIPRASATTQPSATPPTVTTK